jgi:hypothetical protein
MSNKTSKTKEKDIRNPYNKLDKNSGQWMNRILVVTPTTGTVRMEWVHARYNQIIPTNWSQIELTQWMSSYVPMEYQLPDAENLIAKQVVEGDFQWMLSIEEDNILPPDTFKRLNEYMISEEYPVVSALYFTKSVPPEPLIYRGRGNGSFRDFKLGDKVMADGVPFGCTLIHGSLIKTAWEESPEYKVGNQVTRRVFQVPDKNTKKDDGEEDFAAYGAVRGTTDLEWCTRLIEDRILEKAGWPEFQKKKYPFLVDTNIFVGHIDKQGRQYPLNIPAQYSE